MSKFSEIQILKIKKPFSRVLDIIWGSLVLFAENTNHRPCFQAIPIDVKADSDSAIPMN